MDNFTILLKGLFEVTNLNIKTIETKKKYPKKINDIINKHWVKETQKSLILFNGKVFSLNNFSADEKNIFLTLQQTDFKSYLGTNLNPEFTDTKYLANVLGLNILLQTSDNFFLFGKRSKFVAEMKNMWHCIGGNLDSVNPVENAIKELKEEINLDKKNIRAIKILGLLNNHITKRRELLFLIKSSLDKNTIKLSLNNATDKKEHTKIDFFNFDSLKILYEKKDVTPGTKGLIKVYLDLFQEKNL